MFANVQEYYHAMSLRDALKKLGKDERQIPMPVTGALHLISTKLRRPRAWWTSRLVGWST